VVSVALPQIGTRLGASPTGQQWVVDAYILVYAALLVLGGTLGDRLGRKRTYLAGVLLFGVQTAVGAVPENRVGMASAVHNALRQQGQVFGVAVLDAIVYAHRDYVAGFRIALLTSGSVLLAAAITAALLVKTPRPGAPRKGHPAAHQVTRQGTRQRESLPADSIAARAASSRATGTRNGEQDT
jgi:MFS family permease